MLFAAAVVVGAAAYLAAIAAFRRVLRQDIGVFAEAQSDAPEPPPPPVEAALASAA